MTSFDAVAALRARVDSLSAEVGALQDANAVRKLQHAYGYYLDKCLYDEVVDLFADDGEVCQESSMKPQLELVFELDGVLEPAVVVGETPQGLRRMVAIRTGTVVGPDIRAKVLPGGADWQFLRPDGVSVLEARYLIETDDGVRIQVTNFGLRHGPEAVMKRLAAGEAVDPSEYYFRAAPQFSAPAGRYDWLNRNLFLCTGTRAPLGIHLWVYRVG
jgi:hypothetical protein